MNKRQLNRKARMNRMSAFYDAENWITKERMQVGVGLDSAANTLDNIETLFRSLDYNIKGRDLSEYSSQKLLDIKQTADSLVYWAKLLAENLAPGDDPEREPEEFTADRYQEMTNKREDENK